MWSSTGVHEPPCCRGDGGKAYIPSNNEVAEEEPAGNEGVLDVTRGLVHDVNVGGIEAEGRSRESVCDQVDPEQLDWDEGLRETEGSCQENAVSADV